MLRILSTRTYPPSVTARVSIEDFRYRLPEAVLVPGHATVYYLGQGYLDARRPQHRLQMRPIAQVPLADQRMLLPVDLATVQSRLHQTMEAGIVRRGKECVRSGQILPQHEVDVGVEIFMSQALPGDHEALRLQQEREGGLEVGVDFC